MCPSADPPDNFPSSEHQRESLQSAESPSLNEAESWARRALGADRATADDRPNHRSSAAAGMSGDGRSGPMRRRFARDGEVTVVVAQPGSGVGTAHRTPCATTPPVNRLANAEAALAAEQAARQRAERALADAQSTIKRLQTQVAHVEMTGREALEAAQRAESERAAMAAVLEAERAARLAAEAALHGGSETTRPPARLAAGEAPPMKRPRGRPRRDGSVAPKRVPTPKPVKWW